MWMRKTKLSYWIQVLGTKEYLNSNLVMELFLKEHMWQISFKQLGFSLKVQKWNYINSLASEWFCQLPQGQSASMGEKWMKCSKTACGFFAFLHEIVFQHSWNVGMFGKGICCESLLCLGLSIQNIWIYVLIFPHLIFYLKYITQPRSLGLSYKWWGLYVQNTNYEFFFMLRNKSTSS